MQGLLRSSAVNGQLTGNKLPERRFLVQDKVLLGSIYGRLSGDLGTPRRTPDAVDWAGASSEMVIKSSQVSSFYLPATFTRWSTMRVGGRRERINTVNSLDRRNGDRLVHKAIFAKPVGSAEPEANMEHI